MRLHNTLSGKKEKLVTLDPHKVNIYVCGPTTYNYIHLGNARPIVVFDTVRRYLAFRGYEVKYVQNFTDVDDKIIKRAGEEGEEPLKLAERYINEYFKDADSLGVKRADIHPRVSQHIDDIIELINGLIEKGFAYEMDGDVYYRVRAFKEYGKLSKRDLEDMMAGARIEIDTRKENAADFALWKKSKLGEPFWDSPWGAGRPGWHIECSVMSMKYLGETLDIHGGGADLIFPHHENEIAQSEAYTGKPFANYWMHNGFITVNNEKMSKSLGNFFIVRDILNKYPADVVRYYLVATHYRSPLDFDDGKLEEARKALGRLKTSLVLAGEFIDDSADTGMELDESAQQFMVHIEELEKSFIEAMDDDFNTAKAIGFLFEISHSINSFIADADSSSAVDKSAALKALKIFKELGDILGIFMERETEGKEQLDSILQLLLDMRNSARKERNYELADSLRDILNNTGVKIEDNPDGSRFRYESEPDMNDLMNYLVEIRQDLKQRKEYAMADFIREQLSDRGIVLEDTREGARWKFAES